MAGKRTLVSQEQKDQVQVFSKRVAFVESKVAKLIEMLGTVLEDTKGKVERKQAQTLEELQV